MLRYMHAYIKKPSTPTSEAASLGVENWEGLPRSWAAAGAAAVSVGAALGHRSRSGHECHVSRVTRLQLRVFVTTVVLMLSRAWSRVRAARREAAERAVARARSWLQPSPAQPSPAQHHTWSWSQRLGRGRRWWRPRRRCTSNLTVPGLLQVQCFLSTDHCIYSCSL